MMRFRRTVFIIACFVGFVISPAFAQPAGDLAVELSGFSVSEAYDLNAGDALDLSDGQLMKLLFRSEKVSSVNFEKWSQFAAAVSWPQLQESPEQFRFWTFKRKLTLRRLTQIRFPVGVATDELKGVYLAECTYADGGGEQPVFLVTRSAPRKLTLKQTLEQPIAFSGFFYNNVAVKPDGSLLTTVGSNEEDRAGNVPAPGVPLFIAKRFAWFPTGADPAMSVSDGQVELAARGVDVGLFDYVRNDPVRRRTSGERSVELWNQFHQIDVGSDESFRKYSGYVGTFAAMCANSHRRCRTSDAGRAQKLLPSEPVSRFRRTRCRGAHFRRREHQVRTVPGDRLLAAASRGDQRSGTRGQGSADGGALLPFH